MKTAAKTWRWTSAWVAASFVAALVVLTAQTPLDPDEARSRIARGDRAFAEARYGEAFESYTAAVATSDPQIVFDARKRRVPTALRLAQFMTALRDAEAVRAVRPDEVDSLTLHADALWASGLFDEAEAGYASALRRFPSSLRARFGLARSSATKGQLPQALGELNTVAAAAPDDIEVLGFLGHVYEKMRRYDDAIRIYERTLPRLPRRLRSDSSIAGSKIKLLRGFSGRTPIEIEDESRLPLTMPFRLVDRKIVVDATLNGRPVPLVVDTGSERMMLTHRTASRLRLRMLSETVSTGVGPPSVRGLELARVDTLELGGLRINNVPTSVSGGIPNVPQWQSESLSPLSLGLSVIVDYQTQQITLGRQLPKDPNDLVLPMRAYRLPLVRGLLNTTHPAYFVVDTGGELLSISSEVAGRIGPLPGRRISLLVYGVNGRDRDAFLLPGVDLGFESLEYSKRSVAVLNLRAPSVLLGFQLGGILGYGFLSPYRVVLDLERSEVRLRAS